MRFLFAFSASNIHFIHQSYQICNEKVHYLRRMGMVGGGGCDMNERDVSSFTRIFIGSHGF